MERWSSNHLDYRRLVVDQGFNVASPKDGAVFYSNEWDRKNHVSLNRQRAEAHARQQSANGKPSTTLEQTPGGAWLDNQKLRAQGLPISEPDARATWNLCSRKFAENASGSVRCFVNGSSRRSVFRTVEMKALIGNLEVTEINGIPRKALAKVYAINPDKAFALIQSGDVQMRANSSLPAEAAAAAAGGGAGTTAGAGAGGATTGAGEANGGGSGGAGGGPPAARITDNHVCPMFNGPVPHVGGPIIPPCCPTVLIGGIPAARITDMLVCVGPTDIIAKGSATVLIGGLPAARIGDPTVHGGFIVTGMPTVLIGG